MLSSDVARGWVRRASWIALVALALALSLTQITSHDYWWHLRTGQLIAETGVVPKIDPYTYTVPARRWIDVHWLFQLGLFGVYRLAGHAGAVLSVAATALGVVAILAPIGYRRERAALSAALLAGLLLLLGERLMPRPELPTFLLLAGVLALLERHRARGDAWVLAVPLLQLVWVNVHGLWPLGLALCGFYLLAECLEWLGAGAARPEHSARMLRLGLVSVLGVLVSFANPNGLDGVLYPVAQLQMIGPSQSRGIFGSFIAELAPTLSPRGLTPLARAVFIALAAASVAALALGWRRAPRSDLLVLASFLYLGLQARRNAALFAIVAVPLLVRNANALLDARGLWPRVPVAVGATVALATFVAAADAVGGGLFARTAMGRAPGLGVMEILRPVAAVDWIERVRPPGPIAHDMADGGYLIWRLYPDYPVMLDGRLEVFGEQRVRQLMLGAVEQFQAYDARYRPGIVLLNHRVGWSDRLVGMLRRDPAWRLVFVDDSALVFARAEGIPASRAPAVDLDAPDLFPPLVPESSPIQQMRLWARLRVYSGLERWARALEVWETILERYPEWPDGTITHAHLLRRNGRSAEASALLRDALAEDPGDPALHTQLGFLHRDDGDPAAARASFEAALALDPGYTAALMGMGGLAEAAGNAESAVRFYERVLERGRKAGTDYGAAFSRLRALGAAGAEGR